MSLQDIIAITVAAAAIVWVARRTVRSIKGRGGCSSGQCSSSESGPAASKMKPIRRPLVTLEQVGKPERETEGDVRE
jgi:hypothetical protein